MLKKQKVIIFVAFLIGLIVVVGIAMYQPQLNSPQFSTTQASAQTIEDFEQINVSENNFLSYRIIVEEQKEFIARCYHDEKIYYFLAPKAPPMSQGAFFDQYELFLYDTKTNQTTLLYSYLPETPVNIPNVTAYKDFVYWSMNDAQGDWAIYEFDVIKQTLQTIRQADPNIHYSGIVTIDVYPNYVVWYEFYGNNNMGLFYYQIDLKKIQEFTQDISIASPYWAPYFNHGYITYIQKISNKDSLIINENLQDGKKTSLQIDTPSAIAFYQEGVFSWQISFDADSSAIYAYDAQNGKTYFIHPEATLIKTNDYLVIDSIHNGAKQEVLLVDLDESNTYHILSDEAWIKLGSYTTIWVSLDQKMCIETITYPLDQEYVENQQQNATETIVDFLVLDLNVAFHSQ